MEKKEITVRSENILTEARELEIQEDGQFQAAGEMVKDIKALQKSIDEEYDPAIKAAHEAHMKIMATKKKQSEPLKTAEGILKEKIAAYRQEAECKRREEEARRREELRKQEEERRLREAEETGDESILDEPIIVPDIASASNNHIKGISFSEKWDYRIVDFSKLPDEYKLPNKTKLGQIVRALKTEAGKTIPGIEVFSESVVSARAS